MNILPLPRSGICYISVEVEIKEEPSLKSKSFKKLRISDIVVYEGIIENEFGKWLIYRDKDSELKRYILAENFKKDRNVIFPELDDGIYAILPLGKRQALSSVNSNISLKNIDLKPNQKFIFQLIPREKSYRIICVSSGKELTIDSNNGNLLKECNPGSGIKWMIKKHSEREFSFQAHGTNKFIKLGPNEKAIAINAEENEEKFLLIFLGKSNHKNDNNNKEKNKNINKDGDFLDEEEEEEIKEDDNEDDDYEETIYSGENSQHQINHKVKQLLEVKERDKKNILKFKSPKIIIIKEDLNGIQESDIKHIEIDISVKAIEKNIFDEFKNLESVYCHPRWINRFNSKKSKILNIREIYIKEGVTQIKRRDFRYCTELKRLYIPRSVTKIENHSFDNCLKLQFNDVISEDKWYKKFCFDVINYKVPDGTIILRKKIFYNWKNLKSVKIPSTVNQIESSCFERCSKLDEIIIPNNVKIIPENCFKNCGNLKSIEIPDSVNIIHPTAFIGCINLNIIKANERIKNLFQKTLEIPILKKNIEKDDYKEFPNIETLEIPLQAKVNPLFFKNFKYLRVVNFDPFYLTFIDSSRINVLIIPEGIRELNYSMFKKMICLEYIEIPISVTKIDDNTFSECINIVNIKCQAKWISKFNRKIITSITLFNGDFDIKKDIFSYCENLEYVLIPEMMNILEDYLFRNCRKLRIIEYFSGEKGEKREKKIFKSVYEVPNNIKKIRAENYYFWSNVSVLKVNENVKDIEKDFLINCELEIVQMDPKFLKCIPKSEILLVIVPNFVKIIDENDFDGCKKLKKIIVLGDTLFKGNKCKDFERISILECNPYVLKNAKDNIRNNIKEIIILDGSVILDSLCLQNYKNLSKILFPDSVKVIDEKCFLGCENLKKINIPKTVSITHNDIFEKCNKLTSVSINVKNIACLPKESISQLKLLGKDKDLNNLNFKEFTNLKKIEFSKDIEKINSNNLRDCPKLKEITCSKKLFCNLDKEIKKNFQNVGINDLNGEIPPNMFKDCPNLENINIPYREGFKKEERIIKITSIDDIIEKDQQNSKYRDYLFVILEGIKNDKNPINGLVNSLEEISHCIIDVCIKIKNYTKKKNKPMIPHPVQCITILRICDEILNSKTKGSIAEVKTGEGKSFIIAVIAIVLRKHGRLIDVVTSNMELATRDQDDQKEYYNLFGIPSGVLIDQKNDKNFTSLIKSVLNLDKTRNLNKSNFNLDVFSCPIVYSTNYNFQFVYLQSLFSPENLRKRDYDVVIVDEVDNMLLDQSSSPAIISDSIEYLHYKDILEIIYLTRDKGIDEINDIIHYYFPKGVDLEKEQLSKLLNSVKIAQNYERDIHYVISEKDEIIIIDHTTGYVKPGSRWQKGIHEFVEIKEKKKIKNASVSTCSITQCTFFNMYNRITGLSGTLGSLKDQEILKKAYGLNLFHIPRNKNSYVPIFHKQRPQNINHLFKDIEYEIIGLITKGRPVLLIFNYIILVEAFIDFLNETGNYAEIDRRVGISTILGEKPENDKKSILIAGKSGHVTIATAAAGRGMDIKLDSKSLNSGGLHVILPFPMQNERVFWQCVGRCGRQGQPGSVTQYISEGDQYYDALDFHEKYENLFKLQNKFVNFLRTKWSWIYEYKDSYKLDVEIPYGCSIEKMLGIFIKKIGNVNPVKQAALLTSHYRNMILTAWGMFYTNISDKMDDYSNYQQMEEEYSNFLSQLFVWIPENCGSLMDAQQSISRESFKRIDWMEVIITGLDIAELITAFFAPEVAIGIAILKNGLSVLNDLLKGKQINWAQVLIDTGISLLPLKQVSKFAALAGKTLQKSKLLNYGIKGLNRLNDFNKRIKNNPIANFVKGVGKDIVDRRDEYLSAIGDIATDISKGEKKTESEDTKLLEESMVSATKFYFDIGHEVLFKNESFDNAVTLSSIKGTKQFLSNAWKDNKSSMKKAVFNTLADNAESTLKTLVKNKNILILPNNKVNDHVIQEILETYPEKSKNNLLSMLKEVSKKYGEERKRNHEKFKSMISQKK